MARSRGGGAGRGRPPCAGPCGPYPLAPDPSLASLSSILPDLEALYTDVHAHPELSLQETRTSGLAADRLRTAGFDVTAGAAMVVFGSLLRIPSSAAMLAGFGLCLGLRLGAIRRGWHLPRALPSRGADRPPRREAARGRRGYGQEMATSRMPALFVGHGNPMNALARNAWTDGWARLAAEMPRPAAIIAASAHWYLPGSRVTANEQPPTIHDFGGFPRPLYDVRYPAPGAPDLARRVQALLAPAPVVLDDAWGLDHGTWSVLVHMYPDASIPVIQLGIDETAPGPLHLDLARRLRPLREEGVLVLGSGNVVHNLHAYGWGRRAVEPYGWAVRFEARLRSLVEARDLDAIAAYERLGEDAMLSAPTPDHFLPLLYVLAQHQGDEPISFPVEGVDGGSISMLCARVG